MDPVVFELAKWGTKQLLKGAGGQASNLIFHMMFASDSDRLEIIEQKLDQLQAGQEQIKILISNIPERVRLHSAATSMYTRVSGMLAMVGAGELTEAEYADMNAFVGLSAPGSARAMCDDLMQALFGTGNLAPRSTWIGRSPTEAEDVLAKITLGALNSESYVRSRVRDLFSSNGNVVSLTLFFESQMALYAEIMALFSILGLTYQVVENFLKAHKRRDKDDKRNDNPALMGCGGLAAILSPVVMGYLDQIHPDAFKLYHSVFIEEKSQRLAIIQKIRDRIVECDPSEGRMPIRWSDGDYSYMDYNCPKVVYAEYGKSMLDAVNPNLWWEISKIGDDRRSECVIRSIHGEHYLGVYRYPYCRFKNRTEHTEEVAVASGRTSLRARWRILVRIDDGEGLGAFVFENVHAQATLVVSGEDSETRRQTHCNTVSAAKHDEKAFYLIFGATSPRVR